MLSTIPADVRKRVAPVERWVSPADHAAEVADARSMGYAAGEMEGWLRGLGVGLLTGALMAGALALALMPSSWLTA